MKLYNFLKYARYNEGATLVEFAIIFPVYLLFVFGIIELGYVLWGYSALEYAGSYGARYAFVNPTASSSSIQTFILSKVDLSGSSISYSVTVTPNVSADISGTFTYSFLYLPLDPITITTTFHQALPTAS